MVFKPLSLIMCFVFFICLNPRLFSAPLLGDRLVVEINKISYSQRQVEAFYLLRSALTRGDSKTLPSVNDDNWPRILDLFIRDMTIFQEAERLGSFQPSEKMLDAAKGVINEKVADNKNISSDFRRLGIDDRGLMKFLSQIVRIEAFRRSKERLSAASGPNDFDEASKENSNSENFWIKELEDRAVVRYFNGAKKFQPISPNL